LGERVGRSIGADAGAKERLVGIDVADAGHDGLVEENGFDRGVAMSLGSERRRDNLGGGREGIGPSGTPPRVEPMAIRDGDETSEAPRIAKDESFDASGEFPLRVTVAGRQRRGVGRLQDELTAHAEVDAEDPTVLAADRQLLPSAIERSDASADEHRCVDGIAAAKDIATP
jgi:hypothetical protein